MKNFNKIYNQYHRMVLIYLSKRLPTAEAEDLTQEVFIKICDNLHKYDNTKAAMSTWIMRITKHTLTDKFRKRKLDTTSISSFVDDDGDEFFEVSLGGTPLSEMMENEYRNALIDCIITLPKTYRRMANLFYNLDMSYEEVAIKTNSPIGTVKGRLSRARDLMKDRIVALS